MRSRLSSASCTNFPGFAAFFFYYFRLEGAGALFRCGSVNQRRLAIRSRRSSVALASIFNFTKGQAATLPVPEEVVVG